METTDVFSSHASPPYLLWLMRSPRTRCYHKRVSHQYRDRYYVVYLLFCHLSIVSFCFVPIIYCHFYKLHCIFNRTVSQLSWIILIFCLPNHRLRRQRQNECRSLLPWPTNSQQDGCISVHIPFLSGLNIVIPRV